MNWRSQTVLVTGADGFIGSHLAERLVELGAKTRAFVFYNPNSSLGWLDDSPVKGEIEAHWGDIRDQETLHGAMDGVDMVFHLAALIAIPYSYRAPLSYVRTNVEGTLNVLQAARAAEVRRFIHTSTSEVYGTAQYVPIDENHPLQGQSPYAASKIAADKMAEAFYRSFDFSVVTVRPFNTYGPRQSARAVIPAIITQVLTQSELRLGNLSPLRDLNFVLDTVEGFINAAECSEAAGQVFNIGTGREISIRDLAAIILDVMNKNIPIVQDSERVRPANSEVDRLCANAQKARALLGWKPAYTLEDGVTRTVEWIESNSKLYPVGLYAV